MNYPYKPLITCCFLLLLGVLAHSQTKSIRNGLVTKSDTTSGIPNVLIVNKNKGQVSNSDNRGHFKIYATIGDTLEIKCVGYLSKRHVVKDTAFLTVYLEPTTIVLDEVVISGKKVRPKLEELAEEYSKKQGIYFKGRPPIALLSPFDGSPITFFYELLSKGGRRTRRLYALAKEQSDYDKIESRFNNETIRKLVPLEDRDLDEFKATYWPSVEEIDRWTDYELYRYIRKSFEAFQKK